MTTDQEPTIAPAEPGAVPASTGPASTGPASTGPEEASPEGAVAETAARSRASERGAATRSGLLEAARDVFTRQGYSQAGVTDIVTRAGASVGSLYHHYSGKAELYFALFDELNREQAERTRNAVRDAVDAGVTEPMQLFLAGARAYLDAAIDRRELSRLFSRGDGPPGFEDAWQQRLTDWVARNTEFFARTGEPLDEAVAIVLTGAMWVAVSELSRAADSGRARDIADGVISVLGRLGPSPSGSGEPA